MKTFPRFGIGIWYGILPGTYLHRDPTFSLSPVRPTLTPPRVELFSFLFVRHDPA
jgi:hypothetical protein